MILASHNRLSRRGSRGCYLRDLSCFFFFRRGWRASNPKSHHLCVIETKPHACVRAYMRVCRMRAARSSRRGRRITCPRHVSPMGPPPPIPVALLGYSSRRWSPYGRVCSFTGFPRANRLTACACPVFSLPEPEGTRNFPSLINTASCYAMNRVRCPSFSLPLSFSLFPSEGCLRWRNDSSEMQSLGTLNW